MFTFATLFSGGGLADVGLMAAGGRPLWAVEYDPAIAGVYRRNVGDHVLVADVGAVDYSALPAVDWLHASPVCTRASLANAGAVESPEDIASAQAVVRAIRAASPAVVTVENVWGYRKFAAFGLILQALGDLGYFVDFSHVNAAEFGVPQTRRRLILLASRCLLPPLPQPVAWVSWYAAISDLLPALPDSALAPWQAARLPADLCSLLLDSKNTSQERGKLYRAADEPCFTVVADDRPSHRPRAILIDGNNGRVDGGAPIMRAGDEPAFTLAGARAATHRAAGPRGESVQVVSMTARALARFQSIPDWYLLPNEARLAAKVIGNAVPPLLMERIAESLILHHALEVA